ncbi:BT_2262 family domain-containing protein [Tenacibaculum sp. UWU-22]|uniref:BT_2262 family domain-containing protein n=1 Tax=Tenacibaculum sp. UWU-22 TaxID=3234187 RepID=UPI0034DB1726
MKKIFVILLSVIGLISCKDNSTEGISTITNYPVITINGDQEVFVTQGSVYNDAGAVSTEGETEITTNTSFSSGVYWGAEGIDTDSPDSYVVNYSAENKDGFYGNAMRHVWVGTTGDLVSSIEGIYLSSIQRAPSFASLSQYDNKKYVIIKKLGVNKFEISHAAGGYYDYGRGYGPDYAARGAVITVNSMLTNDFSISQAKFPVWGNTVDITDFKVDSTNKTITFTGNANFGNGTFKVQLKQVNF